jgi:hypothetical protein
MVKILFRNLGIYPAARTAGTLIRPLRGHLPPREGLLPVRFRIGFLNIATLCRVLFRHGFAAPPSPMGKVLVRRKITNCAFVGPRRAVAVSQSVFALVFLLLQPCAARAIDNRPYGFPIYIEGTF